MLKFWSFFSGAGLLDAGFAQAGIEHVLFCESDPWRREMLRKRWPGVPVLEDIRKLRAGDAATPDGIAGGFPCKGVSSAGNRNGFDHPETVLWREMARVVGEVRPTYVVLENVANLLTLKKGLVWQEVLETLATLGFDVVWDCIPAAAVGAPHRRDRVFAVAAHAAREPERAEDRQADAEPGSGQAWPLPVVGGHAAAADALRPGLEGRGLQGSVADRDAAAADAEREPLRTTRRSPETWEPRRAAAAERHGNNGIGMPLPIALKLLPTPTSRATATPRIRNGRTRDGRRRRPSMAASSAGRSKRCQRRLGRLRARRPALGSHPRGCA
jgi:DNA (cytosine-5)-methyltransferase 1